MSEDNLGAKLHSTLDADVWAKAFMRVMRETGPIIEEDFMRTWFANAIMCGWDIAHQKMRAKRDGFEGHSKDCSKLAYLNGVQAWGCVPDCPTRKYNQINQVYGGRPLDKGDHNPGQPSGIFKQDEFGCCGGNDDRPDSKDPATRHPKAHTMDCDHFPGVVPGESHQEGGENDSK